MRLHGQRVLSYVFLLKVKNETSVPGRGRSMMFIQDTLKSLIYLYRGLDQIAQIIHGEPQVRLFTIRISRYVNYMRLMV
jgi:hypothetical protein